MIAMMVVAAMMEVEQKTRRSDDRTREYEDPEYSGCLRFPEHFGKADWPLEGPEPAERLGAIVKHEKNVEADNLAAVGSLNENSPTRPGHCAYFVDGYFCFGIGNASVNWKEAQRSQLNSLFVLARWPRLE